MDLTQQAGQFVGEYRYVALFLAALAEGPVVSFVAGVLVALGQLQWLPAFLILAFKDLVLDTAFYALGRAAHVPVVASQIRKIREGTKLGSNVFDAVERGWREHPAKLMWVGKLAYGLSAWFLVSAGIAGLSFKKFYLYTLPVTIFQFGGLMTLGYLLGASFSGVVGLWLTIVGLVLSAVVLFFIIRAFARMVRQKYIEQI